MTTKPWRPPKGWRSAIVGPTVKVTGEQLAAEHYWSKRHPDTDHVHVFWERPDGTRVEAVGPAYVWPKPPQGSLAPEWSSLEVEYFLSLGRPKRTVEVLTHDVVPL